MNALKLYELLKQAADYFGVGFHGLDQIGVTVLGGKLILSYGNDQIIRDMNCRIEGEGK